MGGELINWSILTDSEALKKPDLKLNHACYTVTVSAGDDTVLVLLNRVTCHLKSIKGFILNSSPFM